MYIMFMKKFIVFMVVVVFSSQMFANDFAKKYAYYEDYNKAMEVAKKAKKDLFVFIEADHYCPWCNELKEQVLSLEYTNDLVRNNYIPVVLYSGSGEYPYKLDTYVTPTMHFVSYKDGSIIETILGFNNHWRFYEIIEVHKKTKQTLNKI